MANLGLASVAAVIVLMMALRWPFAAAQLRPDYYASICPNLETIIRNSVRQSMTHSKIFGPATLRLFFHDCAVRGCDASIMIKNSDSEWRNPDDQSLKLEGYQTIMDAKAAVDSDPQCRHRVSCADILALAARESVVQDRQNGLPYYQVELGRYDVKVSTKDSVVLPHVDFNLDNLTSFFSNLGLSQTDMIALSGGHTLGAADCGFFQYRIGTDPSMDPGFAAQLRSTCITNQSSAVLDPTPSRFDNRYYQNLQGGRGLLGSDQVLYTDPRSRRTVDYYASNQEAFFHDFTVAITKLGRVGVKTAADGEIRRDCRFLN